MLNIVNMPIDELAKLSSGKSIGFRPGTAFRQEIEDLAAASGWRITDIARLGMQVFWSDIKAMVLTTTPDPDPARFDEIARTARLVKQALVSGIDLNAVLVRALEDKLRAQLSDAPVPR